jgi:hypothetical protein
MVLVVLTMELMVLVQEQESNRSPRGHANRVQIIEPGARPKDPEDLSAPGG